MTAVHVIQRPSRGSRISTFYPIKSLPSLSSLDSAFQLQEYISLLIRLDVHDVESIVSLPGTSKKEREAAREKELAAEVAKEDDKDSDKKNEVQVDQACWIYEQLRRLAQDLSHPLITTLQQECSRATCPEMKAGEWLYLCVAHGNEGTMEQCCAIDYILHTVDSATALLNSPRTFPSRLQIPQTSHRHFASLARRLGRIFAHAYYSHREVFEQAEAESSLYARFLALTSKFDLVPADFLVIPSNHYGAEGETDHGRDGQDHYPPRQQQFDPIPRANLAPKLLRSRSPLISPSSVPSSTSTGGIGEHPTANLSRSRFGRNRTDTMVFADIEYSGVADELAAKARAGEFDTNYEAEAPNTARLATEIVPSENSRDEEPDDMDLEPEALGGTLNKHSMDSYLKGLDILNPVGKTETKEDEPSAPEFEEETVVLAADSVDSATMDEHIQATISEDVDEPESSDSPEPDAEPEPDVAQIDSTEKIPSEEVQPSASPSSSPPPSSSDSGAAPSLTTPSSLPDDDLSNVESEPQPSEAPEAASAPAESSSDHHAQADPESESDTSAAAAPEVPEVSDAQEEAQATASS